MKKGRRQRQRQTSADGGKWTLVDHIKGSGKFNEGACAWIVKTFKPKSVLEFGCGIGYYSNYFSTHGSSAVHAIEPEVMDESLFDAGRGCEQFAFDITQDPIPKRIDERTYELVVSIETAEHIHKDYHKRVFDFLSSKAEKYVVFSAARLGQVGRGHISCRPELKWRDEFLSRGWFFDKEKTKSIREASNKKNINHVRNLQIFTK